MLGGMRKCCGWELTDLQAEDYNLDIMGFSAEWAGHFSQPPLDRWTRPGDAVPEVENGFALAPGVCGCSVRTACSAVIPQARCGGACAGYGKPCRYGLLTDPPYNVNYGATAKDKMRGNERTVKNDNLGAEFEEFLQEACTNFIAVCKGAIYYLHVILGTRHAAECLPARLVLNKYHPSTILSDNNECKN